MFNGNKEKDYRHRLKYMEFVVHYIVWHVFVFNSAVYSFMCKNYRAFLQAHLRRKKTVVFPV